MFYFEAIMQGIKPIPILSLSDWADKYRILSRVSSSEAGKWRTERTPYLKQIMDDLSSNSIVKKVVLMKGSQIGASEMGNNWVGYTIHHDPAPMMIVMPIDKLIRRYVKQRIDPMIESTPEINDCVNKNVKKSDSNTIDYKSFKGGALVIAGANSPANLRSMPAEKVFADEVDAYPDDVAGEGSPLKLVEARQRTFSRSKIFLASTPVVENDSVIEREFLNTQQYFYHVPCPKCKHKQKLVFEQLKYTDNESSTTYYECINKKCKIYNWQKTQMLKNGEYVSEAPENESETIRGYHINSLYSPVGWLSWEQIIDDYLNILKDKKESDLKAFTNTILGETYKINAITPSSELLWQRSRVADWKVNQLPSGVLFLTVGVDVQKGRVECEVVGWGINKQSWSIDYRIFYGDTSQLKVYENLTKIMGEQFYFMGDSEKFLKVERLVIDSGFNTQTVYSWVRSTKNRKIMAIKGLNNQRQLLSIPKPIDIRRNNKIIKKGLLLYRVGTDVGKEELYNWLLLDKPDEGEEKYGYCRFLPYGEEYFDMLTAERMVTKKVKGYKQVVWEKIRERNEALDIRVYARAGASAFGIDRFTPQQWGKLGYIQNFVKPEKNDSIQVDKNQVTIAKKQGAKKRSKLRLKGANL